MTGGSTEVKSLVRGRVTSESLDSGFEGKSLLTTVFSTTGLKLRTGFSNVENSGHSEPEHTGKLLCELWTRENSNR